MAKRADDDAGEAEVKQAKRIKGDDDDAGTLLAVGINCFGQLGLGVDVPEVMRFAEVKGDLEGKKVRSAAAGGMHTAVATADGQVFTMGTNDEGALGRPVGGEDYEFSASKVAGLDDVKVVAVSAGDSHTAALTDDGKVFACGTFRDGQGLLGFDPATEKTLSFICIYPEGGVKRKGFDPATQIASGADHLMFLTEKGKVFTLGAGEQGQLGRIKQSLCSRQSTRVVAGSDKTYNSKVSGTTLRRFLNPQQVKAPGMKAIKKIFCGSWSCAAVEESGRVWGWGLNNYAQLGWRNDQELSVFIPEECEAWTELGLVDIAFGQHHAVGLTKASKVFTVGRGDVGRLGHGNTDESLVPKEVASLEKAKIKTVGCGISVSYAIAESGEAYSWGFGENFQNATGKDEDVLEPTVIKGKNLENKKVLQISGGGQHAVAIVQPK